VKYERLLAYVAETPWAILPAKLHEVLSVLAYRAAGHEFTSAEIRARIGEPSSSAPMTKRGGGVAVIPVRGVIAHRMGAMDESSGGTSTERIGAMLRQVMADDSVGTIVLDVDSPGGTVPGVHELADQIFEMRGRGTKRFVAVANSLMASAAYWIASQCDEIISIPSGRVGSIGVFAAHEDLSAALEKEGIKVTLVSYGKFKVEGNPFEALSAEGLAQMQGRVDQAGEQFSLDVARGRGVRVSAVKGGFGQGRALGASEARSVGLIDGIGTLEAVVSNLVVGRRALTSGASAATLTMASDLTEAWRRRLLALTPEERAEERRAEDEDCARRLRLL